MEDLREFCKIRSVRTLVDRAGGALKRDHSLLRISGASWDGRTTLYVMYRSPYVDSPNTGMPSSGMVWT